MKCLCGCGQETNIAPHTSTRYKKGDPQRYIRGHCTLGRLTGTERYNWKGEGAKYVKQGYVYLYISNHPRAGKNHYIPEHTLIAEKAIGHYLPPKAEVHHHNKIKGDNKHRNLIVCEDRQYHKIIHIRTAAYIATGNAHKRCCTYCHEYDDISNMRLNSPKSSASTYIHKVCQNARIGIWKTAKKLRKEG
jgi:hypothetical protein